MGAGSSHSKSVWAPSVTLAPESKLTLDWLMALPSVNTLTPNGEVRCDGTCFSQSSALSLPRKKTHIEMQRKPRKLLTGYKDRSKETQYP